MLRSLEKYYPLSLFETRGIIENYLAWQDELNTSGTILLVSEFEERHKISFWDALIVSAAQHACCEHLWTEDLNHGQVFGDVTVINPYIRI